MGFFSGLKKLGRIFFSPDVDKWFNWQGFKKMNNFYAEAANDVSKSLKDLKEDADTKKDTLSFDEAMKAKNIDEHELEVIKKQLATMITIFLMVSLLGFIYGIYVLLLGNVLGFIISMSVTLYGLAQTFKYHFWMFEIKNRKLGCTFKEWLQDKVEKN